MKSIIPILLFSILVSPVFAQRVEVGDAYATVSKSVCTIGTDKIGVTYDISGGNLVFTALENKAAGVSYIKPGDRVTVLGAAAPAKREYEEKVLWTGAVPPGAESEQNLTVKVKKGDRIAFLVNANGNLCDDQMDWPVTVDYGGEVYRSADDVDVDGKSVWSYYGRPVAAGQLLPLENTIIPPDRGVKMRVHSGTEPNVGATLMHPSNEYDACRIFTAPKDGEVKISGKCVHLDTGDVTASVSLFLPGKDGVAEDKPFEFLRASASRTKVGGMPAVRLDVTGMSGGLEVRYHAVVFPKSGIIRQWKDYVNKGTTEINLGGDNVIASMGASLSGEYEACRIVGAMRFDEQGNLHRDAIDTDYRKEFSSSATFDFVPWTAVVSKKGDGFCMAPDYLGRWSCVTRGGKDGVQVTFTADELGKVTLKPGEGWHMPYCVIGVMPEGLDSMARDLYDWQYRYLWDYTHDDWYAKPIATVPWYGESNNAAEQHAGHIADLDMNWTDVDRELGYVVCWEDAGWSASKFWANANFEGPDFGETVRYLNKNDMKLCVWAMGHHHYGLFAAKQAAWGDFQWRSDGIGFDENMDGVFRNRVETFLNENPRSSFHTCSSGATFALNFEIQRYTDVNYDSDGPGSEYTNAYWSYLCTPDKWFDNLNCWGDYRYDKGLRNLTQLPKWSIDRKLSQSEDLRYLPDLYKYMLRVGLAGRWSYTVHPKVEGDKDFYVGQRISADGKRSLIIPKHICPAGTKIYPAGLNPNDSYLVEFKLSDKKETRTGADLMKNGITLGEQKENELIFLNMPDRPGSGTDKTPPTAPSAVYVKRETNIGCTGTGVYWTAATDNNHISYYEIKRGGKVLGRAAVGTYFFDREPGWDGGEVYAVRTVDGDGNGSPWTTAKGIADEPSEYSALGCVYKSAITQDWGTRTNPYDTYNGWSAETSKDLKTFEPMKWVNNERTSCIDAGGNCLQPGGAEGYFEAEGARVGRGWQSASENVYCVRVWTAPAGGKVRVSGKATKELYHFTKGGDLTVGVLLNDKEIWNSAAKVGTLDGVFHDLWVDIEKGDKLRFVVGKGSSPENDIIAWIPRIVYAVGEKAKADTVRILCGSSEDYKDNLGNVWGKDRYFTGGRVCFGGSKIDALYAKGRKGTDFTYRIPAKPGTYLVRLMFAETQFDRHFARPVTVTVNNKEVMTNVDIAQAARGVGKPYDRLVRYVVPDKEGNIVINFKGGYEPDMLTKEAMVKALEVVPEHANIVRINCGGELFVDTYGRVWRGDDRKGVYTPTREGAETLVPLSFEGRADFDDSTYKHIEQATPTHLDQDIYRSAAVGKVLEYKIPLASGLYDVCLKFAETSEKTLGKRPMDIYVNGKLTYGDMDPASRAGKTNTAADVRIEDVSPDGHGFINIKIKAKGAKDASLCGIVIE